MHPFLPAGGLVACAALAFAGARMVADRAQTSRFPGIAALTPDVGRRPSLGSRILEVLSNRLADRALGLLGPRRVDRIRGRIDAAGRPRGLTAEAYAGRKAAFTVLASCVGALFLLQGKPVLFPPLAVGGFVWLDVWLSGLERRRQARIERELPDFLDVLTVVVGAGVGFRPALGRVAETVSGPLGEEIHTTLRQLQLGASRRAAFEDLRRRNPAPSLGRLVASLLQAEELGTPLADSLVDIGREMRQAFAQDARRRAARAAPRVGLIVTTIIVPGTVLLTMTNLFLNSGIDLGFLGG